MIFHTTNLGWYYYRADQAGVNTGTINHARELLGGGSELLRKFGTPGLGGRRLLDGWFHDVPTGASDKLNVFIYL